MTGRATGDDLGPVRARLAAERAAAADRLAALRAQHGEFVEASRDTNADDEHDPEGATIAFERSQVETLARQAERRLAEIDVAVARLDAGEYGVCEGCGRPIDPARLEVRPAATRCVGC